MTEVINRFDGDYAFLSNFYFCNIRYNGITYKTAEHAYQATKMHSVLDHDAVMNAETPGQAKRLSKKYRMVADWDIIKLEVMYDIVSAKFYQNADLAQLLLATDKALLIEGNTWHDNFWGSCDCNKCISIDGNNWLGRILTSIRNDLYYSGAI